MEKINTQIPEPNRGKISENDTIYKVYFRDTLDGKAESYALTFFGSKEKTIPLAEFPSFLLAFNDLVRTKAAIAIKNIKEIIPVSQSNISNILNFFVLLYSDSKNETNARNGVLVGNHKELGHILLGIWPYSTLTGKFPKQMDFERLFNTILSNSERFEELLLVT